MWLRAAGAGRQGAPAALDLALLGRLLNFTVRHHDVSLDLFSALVLLQRALGAERR